MLDAVIAERLDRSEVGVRATAGWVAFAVHCSGRDADTLLARPAPTAVSTIVEMQDEQLALVGFADDERRDLYRALRAVAGIGRRSALAVLDCGEALDILRAVAAADSGFFREVPGLGAKRIGAVLGELERRYHQALPQPVGCPVRWTVQARDALIAQGVPSYAADAAVVQTCADSSSAEDLLARARSICG